MPMTIWWARKLSRSIYTPWKYFSFSWNATYPRLSTMTQVSCSSFRGESIRVTPTRTGRRILDISSTNRQAIAWLGAWAAERADHTQKPIRAATTPAPARTANPRTPSTPNRSREKWR